MSVSQREKIILSIVKEVELGNKNIQAEDYGIDMDLFWEISELIKDMNLLKNICFAFGPTISYELASITPEGMAYLKDNTKIMKLYKGIKEFKSWIPGMPGL